MRFTNNRLTNLRIFKLRAYFEKLIWRCFGSYLRSCCFIAVMRMRLFPPKIPCCAKERQSRGFLEGTFKPLLLLYYTTAMDVVIGVDKVVGVVVVDGVGVALQILHFFE